MVSALTYVKRASPLVRLIAVLLALGLAPAAVADRMVLTAEPVEGLRWTMDVPHVELVREGGGQAHFATLEGSYRRKGWRLAVPGGKLTWLGRGSFRLTLRAVTPIVRFRIVTTGPDGKKRRTWARLEYVYPSELSVPREVVTRPVTPTMDRVWPATPRAPSNAPVVAVMEPAPSRKVPFKLTSRLSYFRLDTRDTVNSAVGSSPSAVMPGLGVWTAPVGRPGLDGFFSFDAWRVSIVPASGQSLDGSSFVAWDLAMGARASPWSPRLAFLLSAGLSRLYFVRALDDQGNFTVDQKSVPTATLGLAWDAGLTRWILGVETGATLLFPVDAQGFNVETGHRLSVRGKTGYRFDWGSLEGGVSVLSQRIRTTSSEVPRTQTTDQNKIELGFDFGIGFEF